MLMRGLLVLLLAMNAGVAAWWALRAPVSLPVAAARPEGTPSIELVDRAADPTRPALPAVANLRCYRFGPFASPAAFDAARRAISGQVAWTSTALQVTGPPRGWRVVLPQPDRATAMATAARIEAAGFSDLLVMPERGVDSNAISLGRYGAQAAARERAAALARAGFLASAEPVGGRIVQWLDVAAPQAFASRSAALGLTGTPLDCAGVPRDGRYTIPAPA